MMVSGVALRHFLLTSFCLLRNALHSLCAGQSWSIPADMLGTSCRTRNAFAAYLYC